MKIRNMLAVLDAKSAAESCAERAERTEGFRKIFEKPPAYDPAELIKMVFDRATELTPNEAELIARQALVFHRWDREMVNEVAAAAVMESLMLRSIFANFLHCMYARDKSTNSRIEASAKWAADCEILAQTQGELGKLFREELRCHVQEAKSRGKKAANARHDKPGGSRDKQAAVRKVWASGKYSSRDVCAEQECGALGLSFSAARKALRNTPKPT